MPTNINIEKLYDDEYFIYMGSYKEDDIVKTHIISNYCRIFSLHKEIPYPIKVQVGRGKSMVSLCFGKYSDVLSIPKLMVYNFNHNKYEPHTNYYIKDPSKPITIENITTESPIKKRLTYEEKSILDKLILEGRNKTEVYEVCRKKSIPINSALRYYDKNSIHHNRRNRHIGMIDTELSKRLMNELDNVSSKQINKYGTSGICKIICEGLGIKYDKKMYGKCYSYLNGKLGAINIYKDNESSTTSQQ